MTQKDKPKKKYQKRKSEVVKAYYSVLDTATNELKKVGECEYTLHPDGTYDIIKKTWYMDEETWQKYLDRMGENITKNMTHYINQGCENNENMSWPGIDPQPA